MPTLEELKETADPIPFFGPKDILHPLPKLPLPELCGSSFQVGGLAVGAWWFRRYSYFMVQVFIDSNLGFKIAWEFLKGF